MYRILYACGAAEFQFDVKLSCWPNSSFLDSESLREYAESVMNKLPFLLIGFAANVFCVSAADNDVLECTLQSLTRNYAAKPVEPNAPRWARKYADVPLTVELKLAVPSEQKVIQEISAGNIAITDAKGNTLEWSLSEKESIRGVAKGVTVFKMHQSTAAKRRIMRSTCMLYNCARFSVSYCGQQVGNAGRGYWSACIALWHLWHLYRESVCVTLHAAAQCGSSVASNATFADYEARGLAMGCA